MRAGPADSSERRVTDVRDATAGRVPRCGLRGVIVCGLGVVVPAAVGCAPSADDRATTPPAVQVQLDSVPPDVRQNVVDALNALTAGTPFEGRVIINQPRQPGHLRVTLAMGREVTASDTCIAIPPLETIECDAAFLDSFLTKHRVFARLKDEQAFLKTQDQRAFVFWVIGHELGHIMRGDAAGSFDANSLDQLVADSDLDRAAELAADEYAAAQIAKLPDHWKIESMLIDLLNAEIESKVGPTDVPGVGLIFDYRDSSHIDFVNRGTHPEFVIRGTRMLTVLADSYPDDGLLNMVEDFAKHLRCSPKCPSPPSAQ